MSSLQGWTAMRSIRFALLSAQSKTGRKLTEQHGVNPGLFGGLRFPPNVGEEEDALRLVRQADLGCDVGIAAALLLHAHQRVEVAAEERSQVANVAVAEQQLLRAHAAARVNAQLILRSMPRAQLSSDITRSSAVQLAFQLARCIAVLRAESDEVE